MSNVILIYHLQLWCWAAAELLKQQAVESMGRLATNGEHRFFGMNGVVVDDKAWPDSPKTSNVEDHELVGETQLRGAWKDNESVMRDFASCAQQMADAAKGSLLGVEFNRFTRIGKPTANDCIKGAAIARL